LRILGKGRTQEKAIRELEALPTNHPYRENVLELIYKLLHILSVNKSKGEVIEKEDEDLMRRLDVLYEETLKQYGQQVRQEGRLEGLQQGLQLKQEGEALLTIRQLKRLLGELPPEIEAEIRGLNTNTIEALAEALLDFKTLEDLTNWLANNQ